MHGCVERVSNSFSNIRVCIEYSNVHRIVEPVSKSRMCIEHLSVNLIVKRVKCVSNSGEGIENLNIYPIVECVLTTYGLIGRVSNF